MLKVKCVIKLGISKQNDAELVQRARNYWLSMPAFLSSFKNFHLVVFRWDIHRFIVLFALLPDCREEQYPCTRLYSVHKPCKQCLNNLCFYSLRRVYVINKEICVRTVCAHEELLKADLCRDQFSRCGVAALSGQCSSLGGSCGRSCGAADDIGGLHLPRCTAAILVLVLLVSPPSRPL
uniref:Microfibril associated protein 2 n=1 Tax=Salarias fasciatus TaxID=181472 RepID=A0A672JGK6_SALFA